MRRVEDSLQQLSAIMGNSERPELTDTLRESFCRTNPEVARHFAALTFWSDNRSDLAKAYTLALVLQCAEDVIKRDTIKQRRLQHRQRAA